MMALAAIYVPLDGMNEKGLCVADLMAGDKTETHQRSDKPDLTTVSAIRLLLDHATSVDEALALLDRYDINSSIGAAHHFALADASGRAVVVEYVDNELHVTETPIAATFYLTEGKMRGIGSKQSHDRFEALSYAYQSANGGMRADKLLHSMAAVAQSNYPKTRGDESTQWTLLCDTQNLTVDFYFRELLGDPYRIMLQEDRTSR